MCWEQKLLKVRWGERGYTNWNRYLLHGKGLEGGLEADKLKEFYLIFQLN